MRCNTPLTAGKEIINLYVEGAAALTSQGMFVGKQKGHKFHDGREMITVFQEQGIQVGEADVVSENPFTQMFHLNIIEPHMYLGEIYVRDVNE